MKSITILSSNPFLHLLVDLVFKYWKCIIDLLQDEDVDIRSKTARSVFPFIKNVAAGNDIAFSHCSSKFTLIKSNFAFIDCVDGFWGYFDLSPFLTITLHIIFGLLLEELRKPSKSFLPNFAWHVKNETDEIQTFL